MLPSPRVLFPVLGPGPASLTVGDGPLRSLWWEHVCPCTPHLFALEDRAGSGTSLASSWLSSEQRCMQHMDALMKVLSDLRDPQTQGPKELGRNQEGGGGGHPLGQGAPSLKTQTGLSRSRTMIPELQHPPLLPQPGLHLSG